MPVTLKEIADSLNLSIATVSKVLNNKDHDISLITRTLVLEKAKEMNYSFNQIAKSMKTNQTKTFGFIIPDIKNSFFTDIATSVEQEAINFGYSIFLSNAYENLDREISQIKTLISKRVDGIIIAATNERNLQKESEVFIDRPIVSIDRKVNYKNVISSIVSDNSGGSYEACKYLISLGHRNIMYISGPKNTNTTKERKKGYLKALSDASIDINYNLIRHGDYTIDFGYKNIINHPISKNVTAILCGNDLIAVGVMKALKELGKEIPKDVSIIGIDNTDISSIVTPSLTTISQPSKTIGSLAVKTLMKYINGQNYKKYIRLKQKLIIRNSTSTCEYNC